jgi:hypothetical protein
MEAQLKLNLTRQIHAEDGNTTVPVSFRLPGSIVSLIETVTKRSNKERSKLLAEYVIEGLVRDVGTIAMTDLHSADSLKTILSRG